MSGFFRFPHTPHVAWLGAGKPRDDKVLPPEELRALLAREVVIEEKVDGANLGFSVGDDGILRGQNRGRYLNLHALQGQWKPLASWLSRHRHSLVQALGRELILFGEWCFAVHSVQYTDLPDWFLAFDVYDRTRAEFWDASRRNQLAQELDIATVPELARGKHTVESLKSLLGRSRLTDGPAEGLYVRQEEKGVLLVRAKLVRAEFTQSMDEHWSKRKLEKNRLASGARSGHNAWH